MKFSIILTMVLLAACGAKKPSVEAGPQISIQALKSDFSYELTGVDAEEVRCSTGLQSFKNLHEMCLDLQAPKEYECALMQKKELFLKECVPAGYAYHESVKCEVQLIEANYHDQVSDKIVESLAICVGQKSGKQSKQNYKQSKGELAPGISYEMDLTFNKEVVIEGETKKVTSGTVRVTDNSGETKFDAKMDYHANNIQTSNLSGDGRYIIVQTCQRTWACEE